MAQVATCTACQTSFPIEPGAQEAWLACPHCRAPVANPVLAVAVQSPLVPAFKLVAIADEYLPGPRPVAQPAPVVLEEVEDEPQPVTPQSDSWGLSGCLVRLAVVGAIWPIVAIAWVWENSLGALILPLSALVLLATLAICRRLARSSAQPAVRGIGWAILVFFAVLGVVFFVWVSFFFLMVLVQLLLRPSRSGSAPYFPLDL